MANEGPLGGARRPHVASWPSQAGPSQGGDLWATLWVAKCLVGTTSLLTVTVILWAYLQGGLGSYAALVASAGACACAYLALRKSVFGLAPLASVVRVPRSLWHDFRAKLLAARVVVGTTSLAAAAVVLYACSQAWVDGYAALVALLALVTCFFFSAARPAFASIFFSTARPAPVSHPKEKAALRPELPPALVPKSGGAFRALVPISLTLISLLVVAQSGMVLRTKERHVAGGHEVLTAHNEPSIQYYSGPAVDAQPTPASASPPWPAFAGQGGHAGESGVAAPHGAKGLPAEELSAYPLCHKNLSFYQPSNLSVTCKLNPGQADRSVRLSAVRCHDMQRHQYMVGAWVQFFDEQGLALSPSKVLVLPCLEPLTVVPPGQASFMRIAVQRW